MSNLNITKTGQIITDLNNIKYLVNNFSQTGNTTGWTLTSSTLSNGVVTLSGVNPTILSPQFNVGLDDIIAVEFIVSLPTPSSPAGSGKGIYLGTPTSQGVFVHTFDHAKKTWTKSTSANNNPYFLNAYNLTDQLHMKNYIVGANVQVSDIPWGESSNTSFPARAIQLPSTITWSRLRSGYNSNPAMVIKFSDPRFYNITQRGFYDGDEIQNAAFGKNFINGFQIIEY